MIILPVSASGYVYLVTAINTPRYKIGKSKNPSRRIEQLNQQSCYPLKLLDFCYFDDCDHHEKRVHLMLKRWRVHGEWFEIPLPFLKYTKVWLHDPKCFTLKGAGNEGIVIGKNKQKNITFFLEQLQAPLIDEFPVECKIPSNNEDLLKAIKLLGNFSKLPTINRSAIALKLENLMNISPRNSEEAIRWKGILKKIRTVNKTWMEEQALSIPASSL